MKKWLLRGIMGVVVLIAVVVVVVVYTIDGLARTAVQEGGTYALGVPTKLDSVKIGLMSQKVELSRLEVANPPGFDSPHFLGLADGRLAVSLGSLLGDTVEVPELVLSGINLNLEKKKGKANYQVILDNLKKFESQEPSEPSQPQPEEAGKKFVIRKLSIRDVNVQVDLLRIGGEATRLPIKIDQIELTDFGSGSDKGMHLAELSSVILKAIFSAVAQQAGQILPGDIRGELTAGLDKLKDVGEVTTKLATDATKTGKEIIEEGKKAVEDLGKTLDEAGKSLEEAGKSISEGLGDLLKPEKDKKEEKNP